MSWVTRLLDKLSGVRRCYQCNVELTPGYDGAAVCRKCIMASLMPCPGWETEEEIHAQMDKQIADLRSKGWSP